MDISMDRPGNKSTGEGIMHAECLQCTQPCIPPLAGSLTELQPVYLQVMGLNPLRDDGIMYERFLCQAGQDTGHLVSARVVGMLGDGTWG